MPRPILAKKFRPVLLVDLLADTLDSRVSWSRPNVKYYFDAAGTLQSASANTAPLEYDPSTLKPLGRSIWETRTNIATNNTAAGGGVGVTPTDWAFGTNSGISMSCAGVGVEDGIAYADVRWFGTSTAVVAAAVFPGKISSGSASTAYAASVFARLIAGSLAPVTSFQVGAYEYDSSSVFIRSSAVGVTIPTSAALRTQRRQYTLTTSATTANLRPLLFFAIPTGTTVDFTVRIGLAQLEAGASPSNPIPTSTVAVTRGADVPTQAVATGVIGAEGLLLTEIYADAISTKQRTYAQLDDSSNSNCIQARSTSTGTAHACTVNKVGSSSVNLGAGTFTAGIVQKCAVAYKTGNTNVMGGGVASTAATTSLADFTGVLNRTIFGQTAGATFYLNGWLRKVAFYNKRPVDAVAQGLTK